MFKPSINKKKRDDRSPDVFTRMAHDIDKWNSDRKGSCQDVTSRMYCSANPWEESHNFNFTDPEKSEVYNRTSPYKFDSETENVSPHKVSAKLSLEPIDHDIKKAFDDLLRISKDDRKVYEKFELEDFMCDSK